MPAYVIFIRKHTKVPTELETYSQKAPASLAGRPVKVNALYGRHEVIEGEQVEGAAILEFPSIAEAKQWYLNKKLVAESVSEMSYQPEKCKQKYRLVILRKNLSVQKGERVLFDEVRYFFYITNRWDLSLEQIVSLANGRCDQENVIEQLKNGVNAMRMPVDDLVSNWAYMVLAALAWNLKAWYGLLVPDRKRGLELVRMEFRRFLHAIILQPVQIIQAGRRIVYRLLGYNRWLKDFFATWQRLQKLELVE